MSDNQSNNDYIPSKADYLKAKEVVSRYLKQQSERPKRKCSEKQLAALAAGRAKNKRFKPKFLTE